MAAISFPRKNNLDWLRLLLAVQVALHHISFLMGTRVPEAMKHFPGVPAFYFISGFLIYASYLNAPGWRYFENRFLRLFPGLFFVTIGGAAITLVALGWNHLFLNAKTYAIWFLAQITLGQAYNPALFRTVGTGVINGSLWSITVELLFYLCVPVIVWLEARYRFALPLLMIISLGIYAIGPLLWTAPLYREKTFYDIVAITPIAWGWMFGFGILTAKHFDRIRPWLGKFLWAIVPMGILILAESGIGNRMRGFDFILSSSGNRLGVLYFICYVSVVLWVGFIPAIPRLPFDFSYGVYIWHDPIINLLVILSIPFASLVIPLTLLIAALSWFLVERPSLKLKRRSLRPVDKMTEEPAPGRVSA